MRLKSLMMTALMAVATMAMCSPANTPDVPEQEEVWVSAVAKISGIIHLHKMNDFRISGSNGLDLFKDDIHLHPIDEHGKVYHGRAEVIKLTLSNGADYYLTGRMIVWIFNNKVEDGKAVGKWFCFMKADELEERVVD